MDLKTKQLTSILSKPMKQGCQEKNFNVQMNWPEEGKAIIKITS